MRRNRNGGNNSTKSGGKSNSRRGSNNGHGKWKSRIYMLDKKVRNQKKQMPDFNTAAKTGSYNEDSDGLDKEDGNMKHYTLTCKGKYKRSKKA